jgi:tetratricopeptide (TPR) repeat protein
MTIVNIYRIFRNSIVALALATASIHFTPTIALADDLLPAKLNLEVKGQKPQRVASNNRRKSLQQCTYARQAYLNGNAEQSLQYYLQAIETDRTNPCPYAGAALVMHQSGYKDEAITLMQAAVYLAQADDNFELYQQAIYWLENEGVR